MKYIGKYLSVEILLTCVYIICRLFQQRFPTSGLHLKFDLYNIPVYSGLGLDRCHCIRSMSCV